MYEDFFSERLLQLRLERNISAREMSLDLGQNGSYINRIENKKSFPSMQVFFYICEYLNISPCEFFDEKIQYPDNINSIKQSLNDLTPKQLILLQELISELKKD